MLKEHYSLHRGAHPRCQAVVLTVFFSPHKHPLYDSLIPLLSHCADEKTEAQRSWRCALGPMAGS